MLLSPGDGQANVGRPGLRSKLADWRRDFRPWREQRPFVGGVLVVLAGLEMLLSGPIRLDQLGMNVVLRFGVEGAQATILPLTLVLLGILVIAQPVHRIFYGVIALAISVYSIAGVNLGGWIAGFLLGVIGGVIVVSWAPPAEADATDDATGAEDDAPASAPLVEEAPKTDGPAPETDSSAPDGDAPDADRSAQDASEPGTAGEPSTDTKAASKSETLSSALRALSQKSAAVVLAGAMVLGGSSLPASASAAGVQQDDSLWCVILGACDDADPDPSSSPTESPSPGASEPADDGESENPADGGDVVPDPTDPTDPADGGDGAGQSDDTGSAGDDEAECQEPTQDGEVPPEEADAAPSDPCGEIDPQQTIEDALRTELGTCVKVTFGGKFDLNIDLPGQCGAREDGSVFSLPADLESTDLTIPLTGINGIGLANVPVKGAGERRDAIKISADKVVVDGFWLKSYAYDDGTVAGTDTRANFVSLEGNAQMYVSSIHANLPDGQDLLEVATSVLDGASLIEIVLTATDARMGFLGATSDIQVWDNFREQVWGDETNPIGEGPEAGDP